jgi:hypothetical protein
VRQSNSALETRAYGAPSMRALNRGDKIQVMRNGYYRVDVRRHRASRRWC